MRGALGDISPTNSPLAAVKAIVIGHFGVRTEALVVLSLDGRCQVDSCCHRSPHKRVKRKGIFAGGGLRKSD